MTITMNACFFDTISQNRHNLKFSIYEKEKNNQFAY